MELTVTPDRVRYECSNWQHTKTFAQVLAEDLARMGPDMPRLIIELGDNQYTVWYDQHGATGDNGQPVHGDVTGDYEAGVTTTGADWLTGLTMICHQHVSPHGTSGYGNPGAKGWAAEKVAEVIARHHARSITE